MRSVVFNALAVVFLGITAFLLISGRDWSSTGRTGIAFLCVVFCGLIGNIEGLESFRASLSGIEAKTREVTQVVEEARVAVREFRVLAEMTGSYLIELMAGAGRLGGAPEEYDRERRTRILSSLIAIGLDPEAIARVDAADSYWVHIDYSLGILYSRSQTCSVECKDKADKFLQRWNSEDAPTLTADTAAATSLLSGAAPSRQEIGVVAAGQLERLVERPVEITLDGLAFDPPAQEVAPQEFAERRRVLGEAAGAPEFAGERAKRVVDETLDRARKVLVAAAAGLVGGRGAPAGG